MEATHLLRITPSNFPSLIEQFPTDILIEIFRSFPTSRVMSTRLVCRRWNTTIMNNLKRIVPTLKCRKLGMRINCASFLRLTTFYAAGSGVLTKLDLTDVYLITDNSFKNFTYRINSLKLVRCKISIFACSVLISKLTPGSSLKVDDVNDLYPNILFISLIDYQIKLRKLAYITSDLSAVPWYRWNFSHFVTQGGLISPCSLSLKNQPWVEDREGIYAGDVLDVLVENGIKCRSLNLKNTPASSGALIQFIQNNGLENPCSLSYPVHTKGRRAVVEALQCKGIATRKFKFNDQYELGPLPPEVNKRCFSALSTTETFLSQALTGPCSLALYKEQIILFAKDLATHQVAIRRLKILKDRTLFWPATHYEDYRSAMNTLISTGNWSRPCSLSFDEFTFSDSIVTALSESSLHIKKLKIKNLHPVYSGNFTETKFAEFLITLGKRQSSLELYLEHCNKIGQNTINALITSGLKLTEFVFTRSPEHPLPVALSLTQLAPSLTDCRILEICCDVADWIDTLGALKASEIRTLRIKIQSQKVLEFLEKANFRCLMKLDIFDGKVCTLDLRGLIKVYGHSKKVEINYFTTPLV